MTNDRQALRFSEARQQLATARELLAQAQLEHDAALSEVITAGSALAQRVQLARSNSFGHEPKDDTGANTGPASTPTPRPAPTELAAASSPFTAASAPMAGAARSSSAPRQAPPPRPRPGGQRQ